MAFGTVVNQQAALAEAMRGFAATTAARAPLYACLADGFVHRPEVLAILAAAPRRHRVPVTLFAAIHDLVLADPQVELAQWFPNLVAEPRGDDPVPVAVEFCMERAEQLTCRVKQRPPQTNEVGRACLLLVALDRIYREMGPLAHLDVGASAGLNLLIDQYGYDYGGRRVGGERLVLSCQVSPRPGDLPTGLPAISSRLGMDRSPVDLEDPDQVRWLEACVWPDQADRFDRLRRAIGIARAHRVQVQPGDAVDDLRSALAGLGPGHPVVTTSWVLTYLEPHRRRAFVAELDAVGADLSWVAAESPAYTPELPWPDGLAGTDRTVLLLVRWRGGQRDITALATCHPHGYWLRWC